jgi:hypothetical protein
MTPATITVNFLANFAGPHRVCWRIQGSGNPLVCTNIVECVGGGNTCSAVISVLVDPESCTPVIFEGYIQATCNAEGSSVGQVPFEVTYTPDPSCKFYLLTNPFGTGYPISSAEMGVNCDGTARPAVNLVIGGTIQVCGIAGMAQSVIDNLDPTVDARRCCTECSSVSVNAIADADTNLYYIECGTKHFIAATAPASSSPPLIICAVTGSLTADAPIGITPLGPC